jgi:hypothetical protein
MSMTRRDYVKLADTLGRAVAVESIDGGGEGIRAAGAAYRVALAVADTLHDSGATFDGGRFLDAVAVAASRARSALADSGGGSYGAGRAIDDALAQRRTASRF